MGRVGAVGEVPVGLAVPVGDVVAAGVGHGRGFARAVQAVVGQGRGGAPCRLGGPAGDGVHRLHAGNRAQGGHAVIGGDGGQVGGVRSNGQDAVGVHPGHRHARGAKAGGDACRLDVGVGAHLHQLSPPEAVEVGGDLVPGLQGDDGAHAALAAGRDRLVERSPGHQRHIGDDAEEPEAGRGQSGLGGSGDWEPELHQPEVGPDLGHREAVGHRGRPVGRVEDRPGQADAGAVGGVAGAGHAGAAESGQSARHQGHGHHGRCQPCPSHGSS